MATKKTVKPTEKQTARKKAIRLLETYEQKDLTEDRLWELEHKYEPLGDKDEN